MQHLNLKQGSQEWIDARLEYCTASEAPVMMGVAKHMSRDDLLKYKTTKEPEEISSFTQMIFDKGHEAEEAARPLVEDIVGEELYPVTGAVNIESLKLLASFDGITLLEDVVFEHKQLNTELVMLIANSEELPPYIYWQLEQQLLVSGAEKAVFVVSDGTKENFHYCEYVSVPSRKEQLLANWKQFKDDLDGYVPEVYTPKPEPTPIKTLPALGYTLTGTSLTSNIDAYKVAAEELVTDSKKPLETDQDFADRELLNKMFKEAESKIKLVQQQAQDEITDVAHFTTELSYISELIRQARLNGEKAVKSRKEEIKKGIITKANQCLKDHIVLLNARLSNVSLPPVDTNFPAAIKGKRTVKSIQEAANNELARAKVVANTWSDEISVNLTSYKELAADYDFLFGDLQTIVMKTSEDFEMLVKHRVSEHVAAEKKRQEEERERIRIEELARIQAERDQEEARSIVAEQKRQEEERERIRIEELARIQAERDQEEAISKAAEQKLSKKEQKRICAEEWARMQAERAQEQVTAQTTELKRQDEESEKFSDFSKSVETGKDIIQSSPATQFNRLEISTSISDFSDLENLAHFFGEEKVSELSTDESGNDYELEMIVRRKSIKSKAA